MSADSRMRTAAAIVRAVQMLAQPMDDAPDAYAAYWDEVNKPVADGGGPFTDEDVAALGITAADLVQGVTLVENFNKFMAGEVVVQSIYRITVNNLRYAGSMV